MKYVPEFDGLRALAALAVLAFHTRLPGFSGGFLGVDVFFVLSGYLTTTLAFTATNGNGVERFKAFMARRLLRIWPLLLLVVAVTGAGLSLLGKPVGLEVLPSVFFMANVTLAAQSVPIILGHTWTLAAEIQFYALIAILAISLPSVRLFRIVVALLFAGVTLSRIASIAGGDWMFAYYGPLTHTSGLFLGAVVATLPLPSARMSAALVFPAVGAIALAFAGATFTTAEALLLWIPLVELAAAAAVIGLVQGGGPIGALLRTPVLRRLGVLSYGIYLWHYPIAVLARNTFPAPTAFALTAAASIVLAALSFRLVESPARRLGRDLIPPSSARQMTRRLTGRKTDGKPTRVRRLRDA